MTCKGFKQLWKAFAVIFGALCIPSYGDVVPLPDLVDRLGIQEIRVDSAGLLYTSSVYSATVGGCARKAVRKLKRQLTHRRGPLKGRPLSGSHERIRLVVSAPGHSAACMHAACSH